MLELCTHTVLSTRNKKKKGRKKEKMHRTGTFLMPEITMQLGDKMPKDEKCVQLELVKGKNRSSPGHADSTE